MTHFSADASVLRLCLGREGTTGHLMPENASEPALRSHGIPSQGQLRQVHWAWPCLYLKPSSMHCSWSALPSPSHCPSFDLPRTNTYNSLFHVNDSRAIQRHRNNSSQSFLSNKTREQDQTTPPRTGHGSIMKPLTFAVAVLMGTVCPTLAMPAANQLSGDENEPCCCCDISQGVVSCTNSADVMQCACLDVVCPDDAPTVWQTLPIPEPTTEPEPEPEPEPPADEVECCCCDISQPAISCKTQPADEGCICPLVLCPSDAPTVYPDTKPTPPPTPTPAPWPTPIPTPAEKADIDEDLVPCCCCDISKQAVSCKLQPESEGCFCALVVCPPGAPTIWPERPAAPTTTP